MSVLKFQNPASRDGQTERIDEIHAAYANDSISKSEFEELMADERSASNYLRLKRLSLAILLGMIGFLFLASL